MIIEFTGPMGAGKSTYSRLFLSRLQQLGVPNGALHESVANGCDLVPAHFCDVAGSKAYTDAVSAVLLAANLGTYGRFAVHLLSEALVGAAANPGHRISVCRAIVRKIAFHSVLRRRRFASWAMVLDEGVFHAAHNALVSPQARASDASLERFARFTPLPDLLVVVTAPPEILAARVRQRGDISPRVDSDAGLVGMVTHAHDAFRLLTAAIRRRVARTAEAVTIVELDSTSVTAEDDCLRLADEVAARLGRMT